MALANTTEAVPMFLVLQTPRRFRASVCSIGKQCAAISKSVSMNPAWINFPTNSPNFHMVYVCYETSKQEVYLSSNAIDSKAFSSQAYTILHLPNFSPDFNLEIFSEGLGGVALNPGWFFILY